MGKHNTGRNPSRSKKRKRQGPQPTSIIGYTDSGKAIDIIERYEQLQQQVRVLKEVIAEWAPLQTIVVKPADEDQEQALARLKQQAAEQGKTIGISGFQSWENSCMVEYRIAVRFGAQPEDCYIMSDAGSFPGTAQEFIDESSLRLNALLWRAPLPEDMKAMYIPGVSDETKYQAVQLLSPYYCNPELIGQERQVFDDVFNRLILKELDTTEMGEDEARNRFNKLVKRTYEKMKERRPDAVKRANPADVDF